MSWIFVACVGIAFAWMALFYLWGRGLLTWIKAERDIVSCIPFGYLALQAIYQIIYLPFYFTRGSYRTTVYIWLGIVAVGSVTLFFYLKRHPSEQKNKLKGIEKIGICGATIAILGLAVYISLHVPFYGQDTVIYITGMNDSLIRDSMWVEEGLLHFDHGMCSMFQFFTISSVLTGIRPYYISLFTIRIVGIFLFSMSLYRMGNTVFKRNRDGFSWPALALAILVPGLLMLWGSMYTAEFFYWRINEAKGYCQFVLLPIGFSVFLEMFSGTNNRNQSWKKQIVVGLSAVAVSASSLTPYLFLVLMGAVALLAYDKLKNGWRTIRQTALCMLPNITFLVVYILEVKRIIVL